MNRPNGLRAAGLVALCLALGACSFGSRLRGVAINHNEMVAGAANQLTVMNILRAKAREPLHFTTIIRLNGSAGVTARGNSSVQIKGPTATRRTGPSGGLVETSTLAGTEVTTPLLEGVVTGNSAFEVGVLDTQEFYQGYLASVPASTVAHFLRQGWPEKLLSYVLIGRVEFVATKDYKEPDGTERRKGEVIAAIENEPRNPEQAKRFGDFVNCYPLTPIQRTSPDKRLVPLDKVSAVDLADLAILDGDKFDIDDEPDKVGEPRWIRRRGRTSDSLTVLKTTDRRVEGCDVLLNTVPGIPGAYGVASLEGPAPAGGEERGIAAATLSPRDSRGQAVNDGRPSFAIQLVLRSPDGAMYYLGEYLRAEEDPATRQSYGEEHQPDPVTPFLVVKTQRPAETFVSARFHNKTYYVPDRESGGGRSTQVIALVQELLNLQKSSKDKPATATVRVVQ